MICLTHLYVHIVLMDEVRDLRLCLKSADKELKEVKQELMSNKTTFENKINQVLEKVTPLLATHTTPISVIFSQCKRIVIVHCYNTAIHYIYRAVY